MNKKIILILTLILILVIQLPVYAEGPVTDPPSDVWSYWVIFKYNSGGGSEDQILCISTFDPLIVDKEDEKLKCGPAYRKYEYENNQWNLRFETYNGEVSFPLNLIKTICASNHDIAYDDGSGFFFSRPSPVLSPIVEKVDFGTILKNFSVGLVPLIGLLILAISLGKGWGFLRSHLKH